MSSRKSSGSGDREKTKSRAAGGRSLAEWTTLVASVCVVALILGLLVFQQFDKGPDEPTLSVEIILDDAREAGGYYYLPIRLENAGDSAAIGITVEVLAGDDPEPVAEVEIDAVPGDSDREAVAVLDTAPSEDLTAVVTSFEKP